MNKHLPLKLGAHCCHDRLTAPSYSKSIGSNFIQMFIKSPKSYNVNTISDSDLRKLKKELIKNNCGFVIHSPYIINLARHPDQYQHSKGIDVIVDDMNCGAKIGAIGAVIHMGKNVKSEKMTETTAFNNYVRGVEAILKKSDPLSTLILETGTGCGTEICHKLKHLGKIRKKVNKKYRNRIKFCIDTCHVFVAGYKLHDMEYLDKFNKKIEKYLGWKNVAVIHLNDSKSALGSNSDRHEDIGKGKIGLKPLVKFVSMCREKGIPMVLETPVGEHDGIKFTHKDQLKLIKEELAKLDKLDIESISSKSDDSDNSDNSN